ncbi:MAG: SDR family oxidoreductase [Kofleriaceae bacterium]|jgi:NADP-dependent 3-hydroxy acid dehydrogenase YdfG|nr:SDR family oxidoreductase [Kofleriaceae bacterium]MBP6836131.1 SDR family oxidoreductase [Kofleriaceae bacterium]MBP9206752.1 SDR family oxidoreductase [Kofleriaceae bacterium]
MPRLIGRTAIVTGASSGIGHAIALALAKEGAAVVGMARRFEATRVPAPPRSGTVLEVALDVTDEDQVEARFAEVPALDLLVCSAGVGVFAPLGKASVADLRAMLEVHVVGSFLCARAALRRMVAQRRGHIVLIGSVAATKAFTECGGYTAAKAGQLGLARVLAEEARPFDVRVTSVLPGATDTAIWDDRPGFDRTKMLRPEDVAGFVAAIVARPGIAVEEVVVAPPAGVL